MDKKLTEMTVTEFMQVLASNAPAPGGGSVAALCGSLSASLTKMVGELTLGREKYKAQEEIIQNVIKKADPLIHKLLESIDLDTEAYNQVAAVFTMPKGTDEEKAARKEAMQKALKNAVLVPYSVMELSRDAMAMAQDVLQGFNTNAASDLGVAAITCRSCVQGAWLNVCINLGGIKDQDFANEYQKKGQIVVDQVVKACDEIYDKVLQIITEG